VLEVEKLPNTFDSLVVPSNPGAAGDVFTIQDLDVAGFFLAKSQEGRPAFIVSRISNAVFPEVSLSLVNLRATYNRSVKLVPADGTKEQVREDIVSVVECLADDPNLHSLFISSFGNALALRIGDSEAINIGAIVSHLAELFRYAQNPSQGSILGLWAELWIISIADDPLILAKAWHTDTSSRLDFSTQSERVDVKATTLTKRQHSISFEQANPPESVNASIISVMTEEIGDGFTLGKLWSTVQENVSTDPELVEKIDRLCWRTLGEDFAEALQIGFDESRALDTCQVYAVESIPRFTTKPPGVLNVRFEVDLSSSNPMASGFASGGLTELVIAGLARRRQ
jgi:hypothetical protein